jgi:hypothetical protein
MAKKKRPEGFVPKQRVFKSYTILECIPEMGRTRYRLRCSCGAVVVHFLWSWAGTSWQKCKGCGGLPQLSFNRRCVVLRKTFTKKRDETIIYQPFTVISRNMRFGPASVIVRCNCGHSPQITVRSWAGVGWYKCKACHGRLKYPYLQWSSIPLPYSVARPEAQ